MNVSLTPHFDEFISHMVHSGQYHSASEVIRAALRLLEENEAAKQARIEFYKTEIQKGIDSGKQEEWNVAEFLSNARKKTGLNEA